MADAPGFDVLATFGQRIGKQFAHLNDPHHRIDRAFANGQAYVAFSRIRTLDGVYLSRELKPSDIRVDSRVVSFMKTAKDNDRLID